MLIEREVVSSTSIPTLPANQYEVLFEPATGRGKFLLLSGKKCGQQLDAWQISLALYQVGASLINSGTAYEPWQIVIDDRLTCHHNQRISNKAEKIRSAKLLAIYNRIEKCQNNSLPYNPVINPYHALFIIKVALDNLPKEIVANLYLQLNEQVTEMTSVPAKAVRFPDGSSFGNDHAIRIILGCYISGYANDYKQYTENSSPSAECYLAKMVTGDNDKTRLLELLVMNVPQALAHMPEPVKIITQQPPRRENPITEAERDKIINPLVAYTSFNKLSFLSRTNKPLATQMITEIKQASSLEQIGVILQREEKNCIDRAKDSSGNASLRGYTIANLLSISPQRDLQSISEQSGYYRALQAALESYNQLVRTEQPNLRT